MSTDPIALDTVFCHLVNLDPSYVPTNLYGETLGLGTWHDDRIEIVTADGTISEKELKRKYGIQTSRRPPQSPQKRSPRPARDPRGLPEPPLYHRRKM